MKSTLFVSCAVLALSAGDAAAQDAVAVDEVVVTAQKRAENLQDVPVSVTALSGQSLIDRGVTNVIGLNNLAPGLRVSSGDAAANPKIFIGGAVIPGVLAVRAAGQFVDDGGYTYNRVTGHDLNETRYWALRLSALYTPTEDIEALFQVNRFANRGDATQPQHRALFPLTPGATGPDGFCAPAFYGTAQCGDAFGYVDTDGDDRALDANSEGKDKIDLFGASAHVTWDLGNVSLVSVTAWSWAHRNAFENTDASPAQMLEINYLARQRQFTQELRLQSNDPAARLKWVLGAYYMNETVKDASTQDVLRDLRPLFPDGFSLADSVAAFSYPYTQKTRSYAAFGQADYQVTDRLTATVGLRYSADDKSFDYRSQAEGGLIVLLTSKQDKTFSAWSGRVGLRYALSDDASVYATYNRGFKSGGFFGGLATTPEELIPYDNEKLDAFEVGLKSELFERRLRLNLSAFYYDYQDQQVFAQALRNGLTVLVLDNAANSEVYGAEIEATAKITRNLSLDAGLSLLDATYGEYVSEGDDFSGNRLPQSPKVTFNVAANYSHPLPTGGELIGTVDAAYSSRVYFDNSNADRLSQDGVWVVGAQAGWRSTDGRLEAGLFARNLFDETYVVSISNIDSLGEDLLTLNRPRSLGAFLRYRY